MLLSRFVLLFSCWGCAALADHWSFDADEYTMASVNASYYDFATLTLHSQAAEIAKYGSGKIGPAAGILVHVRTDNGTSNAGCDTDYENELPQGPWIALVKRGRCNFDDKLEAAFLNNASALIVYNNKDDGLQQMKLRNKYRDKIVAVFVSRVKGEELANLVDNGTQVYIQLTVGTHHTFRLTSINRTSVMFVSISFIVLMMISLAWLIFYYVQRFRYLHAKDRLSRQLTSAAQKALSKIPTRTIKSNDKEISEAECCAVCIEPYKTSDVVRLLPCRHEFHKVCVDPWLLEHRTCPMCKMDILKHYGFVFTGSQESIINIDMEAPIITATVSTRARNTSGSSPPSPASIHTLSSDRQNRTPVITVIAGSSSSPTPRRNFSWARGLVTPVQPVSIASESSNSQPEENSPSFDSADGPGLPVADSHESAIPRSSSSPNVVEVRSSTEGSEPVLPKDSSSTS